MKKNTTTSYRFGPWFRTLCWVVLLTFGCDILGTDLAHIKSAEAQNALMIPPGTLMSPSPMFELPNLKALAIDPLDPFKVNFVVDSANQEQADNEQLKLLTKYFLSFLTLPEKDLWVNLSPYEKDRIITPEVEATQVGKDMLVEDYLLKQLASSMTYPEREPGQTFWKKVREKAQAKYGVKDLPVSTFSRVWVVPQKAVVYEQEGAAFISESRLQVLLEEDYEAFHRSIKSPSDSKEADNLTAIVRKDHENMSDISSQIAREIIIPELEREVNEGKSFAPLRQMFHSLILAIWFKKRLKQHLLNQVYVDQKKTSGITINEKQVKEKIYEQYLEAMKKGAYNYIREDYDEKSQEYVPHKYFSGGFSLGNSDQWFSSSPISHVALALPNLLGKMGKRLQRFTVSLNPLGVSRKTLVAMAVAGGMLAMPGIQSIDDPGAPVVSKPALQQTVQVRGTTTVNEAVNAVPTVSQSAKAVSQTILNVGDKISREDQKYFDYLKTHLTPQDVTSLNGKINAQTGQAYHVDSAYFQQNWNQTFSSSHYNWAKETVVIAFQHQQGLKADGDLGPETRAAIEAKLAQEQVKPQVAAPEKVDLGSTIEPAATVDVAEQKAITDLQKKIDDLQAGLASPVDHAADTTLQAVNPTDGFVKVADHPPTTTTRTLPPQNPVAKKEPYVLSTKAVAIPIEENLIAQSTGVISGWNSSIKEYRYGQILFIINNPVLESKKQQLLGQIQLKSQKHKELLELLPLGQATQDEVSRAKLEVDTLQQSLAQVNQEISVQKVTAPYRLIVKDANTLANGLTVASGNPLLTYYNTQRIRLNLQVPLSVNYLGRFSLSINGQPATKIVSADWSMSPSQDQAQLSVVVETKEGIAGGSEVKVDAKIYPPGSGVSNLSHIKGQARTIVSGGKIQEQPLLASANGPIKFMVSEGQRVRAGQILAIIQDTEYGNELIQVLQGIRSLETRIAIAQQRTSGLSDVPREQLDQMKSQLLELKARRSTLEFNLSRLQIRAPNHGHVIWTAAQQSNVFQAQAKILTLRPDNIVIGDVNVIDRNAILLPRTIDLKTGDAIVVETASGDRLAGRVTLINKSPINRDFNLNGMQAIQIEVRDPHAIIWENQPITVIVPTIQERSLIEQEFKKQKQVMGIEHRNVTTGVQRLDVVTYPAKERVFVAENMIRAADNQTTAVVLDDRKRWTIAEVENAVTQNYLVVGGDVLKYLEAKTAEKLPEATRLSLQAGVYVADGKLVVGGGVNGVLNNMISGGISTGNAIGAALPAVFQVAGNIVDLLTGKKGEEKALAIMMTQIAYHHMESAVYHSANQASERLIQIGALEQKINQIDLLLKELRKAKDVLEARSKGGFAVSDDLNALNRHYDQAQKELAALNDQKNQWTVDLNQLLGHSTRNLHPEILANFPDGEFTGITVEQERNLLVAARDNSPEILQARIALEAVKKAAELQGLEKLPAVNLTGLFIDDGKGLNPIYDFVPGTTMRTARMGQGANAVLRFELPLFDSGAKTRTEIKALEVSEAENHYARIKAEVRTRVAKTAGRLRDLSLEIQQAQRVYDSAQQALNAKASRPDLFLAPQLISERLQVAKVSQELIDLKMEYLKAEGILRELRVLGFGESLVKPMLPKAQTRPMTDFAQSADFIKTGGRGAGLWTGPENYRESAEYSFDGNPGHFVKTGARSNEQYLSPGIVTYSDSPSHQHSSANMWTMMRGDEAGTDGTQFKALSDILIQEPNIFTRHDALIHLTTEYQNENNFIPAIENIILSTSYPDVVQDLLRFLADRKDKDLRSFIRIADQAMTQNKAVVVDLAFEALRGLIKSDSQVFEHLSEIDLVMGIGSTNPSQILTIAKVRNVLLTFLAQEPEVSIAKTRLLQSNFWTINELMQIYHELIIYARAQMKSDNGSRARSLARFVKDTILRKIAVENIPEVFRSGDALSGLYYLDGDIYDLYKRQALSAATLRYLAISSTPWANMGDFLFPNLIARTDDAFGVLMTEQFESAKSIQLDLGKITDNKTRTDVPLIYFNSLGVEGQSTYIARTNNISELIDILKSPTALRTAVLDRLMATKEGRLLTLDLYARTADPQLMKVIESRNWVDVLKMDTLLAENTAANDTYRWSLEKMYDRTHQEWTLNVRLRTYTFSELHAVQDVRGFDFVRAQMDVLATRMALELIEVKNKFRPVLWGGYAFYTPQERTLLANIRHILDHANDPREVKNYVDALVTRGDTATAALLKDLVKNRDMIVAEILSNDQSASRFPSLLKGLGLLMGSITLGFFVKGFRRRIFVKQANAEHLIHDLRRQLLSLNNNGQGSTDKRSTKRWFGFQSAVHHVSVGGLVIDIPESINGSIGEPLKSWQTLVSRWSRQVDVDPGMMLNDFNAVLNHAFEVVRLMPFSPELMLRDKESDTPVKNESYQRAFNYFNLLALDTLNVLTLRLQGGVDLSESQRQRLLQDIDKLSELIHYVTEFLQVLESRGIMDRVMSYKFVDDHWTEKSRIYPLLRWILLYRYQWQRSLSRLKIRIPSLLANGNRLLPNFYENPKMIEQKSESKLKEVFEGALGLSSQGSEATRQAYKMRSFLSRARFLLFPLSIVAGLLAWFLGVASLGIGVTIFGTLGMGMTLLIFWIPHYNIIQMSWNQMMTVAGGKLNMSLQSLLNKNLNRKFSDLDPVDRTVALAMQEGLEQRNYELDPNHDPRVDMIVIIAEDPAKKNDVEQYVRNSRGRIFRNDIPVEVVTSDLQGSGNAYFDALQYMKNKVESKDFSSEQYPHVKSWPNSRVMFVFHGKDVQTENQLLDLAIVNGYRAAASMATNGHILLYSRDAYFGPIQQMPEAHISFLASRVDQAALTELGLINTTFLQNGDPTVREILQKLDINQLRALAMNEERGSKRFDYVKTHYDPLNTEMNQFLGLTGLMMFDPQTVEKFEKMAAALKSLSFREQLRQIHFVADIIIPSLLRSEDRLEEYIIARSKWRDVSDTVITAAAKIRIQNNLRDLYNLLHNSSFTTMDMKVFIPYPGSERFEHITSREDVAEVAPLLAENSDFAKLQSPWASTVLSPVFTENVASSALDSKAPGGLDFSKTKDQIQFKDDGLKSPVGPLPSGPSLTVPSLPNFQGFEFQILQFQPLINPAEFLLGGTNFHELGLESNPVLAQK